MLPGTEYAYAFPPSRAVGKAQMTGREEPAAPRRDPKRPQRLAPGVRQRGAFLTGNCGKFKINT